MTDKAAEEENGNSIFNQHDGVDFALASLVNLANHYGVEIGVTITVGGALITGILISGQEYFTEVGKILRGRETADGTERSIKAIVADSYKDFAQLYPRSEGDERRLNHTPKYVHLRAAKMIRGDGQMVPHDGFHWRGKLTDVEGFAVGNLSIA